MYYSKRRRLVLFLAVLAAVVTNSLAQNPNELYKQSVAQMRMGSYSDALISINRVLAIDSSKATYSLQKANIYYYMGKYEEAVKSCYSALKIAPDMPQILLLRGQICLVTKSYGGAIFFFGKVIKSVIEKDYLSMAYLNRGKVYYALGKYNEAKNDLDTACKLLPDSVSSLVPLAETYIKLKQPDNAQSILIRILKLQPDYASAYKLLGTIEYEKKNYTKAIEAINKYISLYPGDGSAFNLLSNIYIQNKDFDNALNATNQAIQLNPADPINFKTLALINIELGQKEKACNFIFRAFQLGYLEKYGYDLLDIYLANCEGK